MHCQSMHTHGTSHGTTYISVCVIQIVIVNCSKRLLNHQFNNQGLHVDKYFCIHNYTIIKSLVLE